MFGLRPLEILMIVLAIFLLFGATRLPQLARSLGQSRKAFKDALRDSEEDDASASATKPISTVSTLTDEEILAEMQRRTAAGSKA